MLVPIFTHGTYANTIKAIEQRKITYPAYLWITDRQQYGFLNKNNELEVIGIPEYTGTLENAIILDGLIDGLYQVNGIYRITSDYPTTFSTTSNVIVIVQTINDIKKIRVITAEDLMTYTIADGGVTSDSVVTSDYLEAKGYDTIASVDRKIIAMQEAIDADVDDKIDSVIADKIEPMIDEKIDENVQGVDNENIQDLFNE